MEQKTKETRQGEIRLEYIETDCPNLSLLEISHSEPQQRIQFSAVKYWLKIEPEIPFTIIRLRNDADEYSSLGIFAKYLVEEFEGFSFEPAFKGYRLVCPSGESSLYRIPSEGRKLISLDWDTQNHIMNFDKQDQLGQRIQVREYLLSLYPKIPRPDGPQGGPALTAAA
jgi:hypothetical protein